MDIFLEGLKILISTYGTFCVCADDFQGLLKAYRYRYRVPVPYKIINFLFAFLELLTSFENAHRRLPVWLCRITGGFLYAFSVSKSPLYVFEADSWKDFQKLPVVINFKGAS